MNDKGPVAVHRLRVSQGDAHYGGNLVAGAFLMELMGDVATELCIMSDGDEGLFAGYSSVEFLRPVHAGDFVEARGEIIRFGSSSREIRFQIFVYARQKTEISDSAADFLDEPELVGRAVGTCVVPVERQRKRSGE